MSPSETADADDRHALAFRIAVTAAAGFTLGHLLGWDFPFLPSLLAVQLLSARRTLDLTHALGFVLLMAAGCAVNLFVALIFADRPLSLILTVGLLIFVEFLALARGRAVAAIFLMTTSFVPLMAVSSLDLAYALVYELIVGSILALLLIFLAHALFPERGVSQQAVVQDTREGAPLAAALANTGVLMTLFVYFMGTGTPTSIIVIMVTAITVLQQSAAAGPGATFGLIAGNIAGGLAATIAYLLITLLPSPAFLFSGRAVLRPGLRGRDCRRWQIRPPLRGWDSDLPRGAGPRPLSFAARQRHDLPVPDIDGYPSLALHDRHRERFARVVRRCLARPAATRSASRLARICFSDGGNDGCKFGQAFCFAANRRRDDGEARACRGGKGR